MHFDALYHDVFADPEITAMLIESFVPAAVVALLDLPSIVLLNSKNYTKDRSLRTGDLMFAVNYKHVASCVGVRLSLEAQSSVDRWMPIRSLEYALLQWNQIRHTQQKRPTPAGPRKPRRRKSLAASAWLGNLPPTDAPQLPAIISMVVFSGDGIYDAATDVHGCIAVPQGADALLELCPQFKQIVVNIKALDATFLERFDNALKWFFELERAKDFKQAEAAIIRLGAWACLSPHERFINAIRYYIKEFTGSGQRQGSALDLYEAFEPKKERSMSIADNINNIFVQREKIGEERGTANGFANGLEKGAALMEQKLYRKFIKFLLEERFAAVGLQFWQETLEKLELAPWDEIYNIVQAAKVPDDLLKIHAALGTIK